jgi:beta-glucanase (GH16 family)
MMFRRLSWSLFVPFALCAACGTSGEESKSPKDGEHFSLLYRDDFDTLDSSRWQLMTHSWDTNLALFAASAVNVEEGALVVSLLPAPDGTTDSSGVAKPFLGAEVRSRDTLTYGRVRARVKFARGPAVVSSLVTIYTPWPADNWNELDIECLGAQPQNLQFNAQVYLGALPAAATPVSPTPDEMKVTLGFDPSADFHEYETEWTPAGARFSIDGKVVQTWTRHADRMNLPQNVLLTIWASSSAGWAGAVTAETSMAKATYDWVELYNYTPGVRATKG